MDTTENLQTQFNDLLRQKSGRRQAVPAERMLFAEQEAPMSVESVPVPQPETSPGRRFSIFDLEQAKQASALAAELMGIADNAGGGTVGQQKALAAANARMLTENVELVQYALMLFATHYRSGPRLQIEPLEVRAPELVLPSALSMPAEHFALRLALFSSQASDAGNGAAQVDETVLNWYREDVKANEHHEHWHVVYPVGGIPYPDMRRDANNNLLMTTKDRQGELFFYMHQQMLARYDTERLAHGLDIVKQLVDYDAPDLDYTREIPEGYAVRLDDPELNPDDAKLSSIFGSPYAGRLPNEQLRDVDRADYGSLAVATVVDAGNALRAAVKDGQFKTKDGTLIPPDERNFIDRLGGTVEATIGAVDPDPTNYGDHHNNGHMLLAFINHPADPTDPSDVSQADPGVMSNTATAIRDPVFYRWHRHIDDFAFQWQEGQASEDFADAPKVRIRKGLAGATPENQSPDIILCMQDAFPDEDHPFPFDEAHGEQTFGDVHWDTDFSTSATTTSELQTVMLSRTITVRDAGGHRLRDIPVTYLDQKEFCYYLRLENLSPAAQKVTIRIFLAAEQFVDNRRMWIEMDKFVYTLQPPPAHRAVIFRPAKLSSVIQKPAAKPVASTTRPKEHPEGWQAAEDQGNYCDCGWPYNLLLPSGKPEGMTFRLLVVVTDWEKDQVQQESTCGSMSFCGAKDQYPDSRQMGYPFHLPFKNRSIAQTIATQDNMATRDITIRLVQKPNG